jgi:hypothetical protein
VSPFKTRQVRDEPPPDDAALLLRGNLLTEAILATTALDNFEVYGFYGISMWAAVGSATQGSLLATKLARQEVVAVFKAGDLRRAGLELRPTGAAPHYDVVHSDVAHLVAKLIECPHEVIDNEHYEQPEEVAPDA